MKSRSKPSYLAITAVVTAALLLTGQSILHFLFGLIGGGGQRPAAIAPYHASRWLSYSVFHQQVLQRHDQAWGIV